MNSCLQNRLFFLIVLFSIFTQIPPIFRLNFIGSFLSKDLSFYPILAGMLYSGYLLLKKKEVTNW